MNAALRPADNVGLQAIRLSHAPTIALTTGIPLLLAVDYSRCLPAGPSGKLRFVVRGPDGFASLDHLFRSPPAVVSFTPTVAGEYTAALSEVTHNRWWGALDLTVSGD